MDPIERDFITRCAVAARMVGHPWPEMAGCEAALESRKPGSVPFALSQLAADDNNLFGMKIHRHNDYGQVALPTKEFLSGQWTVVTGLFEKYPTLEDCFNDRLATLLRLRSIYPHYKNALDASDPVTYVTEVSKTWSTDPARADKCILIYREYKADQT